MKKWYFVLAVIVLSFFYILAGKLVYLIPRIFSQNGVLSDSQALIPKSEDNRSGGSLTEENRIVDYLDRLAKAENCPLEGIIDVNGLSSRGPFCFQKSTYLYFVKRYEIYPYAEEQELLSNWGDSWTQGEIVKKIIEEDKNLLAVHWVKSVKRIGLPQ